MVRGVPSKQYCITIYKGRSPHLGLELIYNFSERILSEELAAFLNQLEKCPSGTL